MKVSGMRDVEIARYLQDKGIKINEKQLSVMWRKPYYCGVIVHKLIGNKVIEGNHEPIVSKTDFLKINKRLNDHTSTYTSYKKDENLPLNKFVKGFECGHTYSGYLVKKKGLYYYKNNRKGSRENISAKKLHQSFIVLLEEIEIRKDLPEAVLGLALKDKIRELLMGDSDAQAITAKRLQEVEAQLKNLKRKYMVLNEITKEDYEEFKPELEAERTELIQKSQNMVFDFSNLDQAVEKAIHLAKNLSLMWSKGTYQTKRAIQDMVFPEGILYDFKNGVSRTNRVNLIFDITSSLSSAFEGNKKGTNFKYEFCPSVVAKTGVEPVTSGL